jgi:uncharacterized membrane protein YsdA (DUF1294 family)/cold shock CspA family protein
MRSQGRITSWKDDQGYGFITPNGGGERLFVHVKAFSNRQHRPAVNEIVTYEITTDEKRRVQATNVEFLTSRIHAAASGKPGLGSLVVSVIFLLFMLGLVFTGKLPFTVLGIYLGSSALAFIAYALDKSAAKNGGWRTKENTLHLLSLAGGWPGALIAQQHLRHKSKKTSFQISYWITVVLNCSVLGWVLTDQGSIALRSILSIVSR